jgi:hypothetical protein
MQQSNPAIHEVRHLLPSSLLMLSHPALGKGCKGIPKLQSLIDVIYRLGIIIHHGCQIVDLGGQLFKLM